jgi:signal transduction histidine kinase
LDSANVEVQHRRIERDIERMNALIEEIIRLERLNSAPNSFQMEELDLVALLDEITGDAAIEAKAGNRRIVLEGVERLTLRGNSELLRRAIENVLRNAIRFSPENSEIEIIVSEKSAHAVISVRDHGSGVPDVDLQRIFEPFYRVSTARQREAGGTGLGLAITARVMALHGGQVAAQNHADGGLVVTLTLLSIASRGAIDLSSASDRRDMEAAV